jgi:hypothetical protein
VPGLELRWLGCLLLEFPKLRFLVEQAWRALTCCQNIAFVHGSQRESSERAETGNERLVLGLNGAWAIELGCALRSFAAQKTPPLRATAKGRALGQERENRAREQSGG